MSELIFLSFVIVAALAYDFVNGFHDAANAIATSIASNAIKARYAIILATGFNFIGALSHTAVAYTIGKGVVNSSIVNNQMLFSALLGAIAWNLITWKKGIPSSSTHALIGGLIGSALIRSRLDTSILIKAGISKIILAMVIAPVLAFLLSMILITIITWSLHLLKANNRPTNRKFKWLQVISAAWMSFSHGMNDAQNAMGVITIALLSYGAISNFHVPMSIRILCGLSMGAGTLFGGWKIIRTIANRLSGEEPMPVQGFSAQTSAGGVIFLLSMMGIPISTSHSISSCVMGTTAANRLSTVNWKVGANMLVAWIITIPISAAIAGIIQLVIRFAHLL